MPPASGVQYETVSVVSWAEAGDEGMSASVANVAAAAPTRSWSGEARRLARLLLRRFVTEEPTGGAFALDFTDDAAVQALFEEGSGSLLTDGVCRRLQRGHLLAETHCLLWRVHISRRGAPARPLPLRSHRLSLVHGPIAPHVQRGARRAGRRPGPGDADERRQCHVWP
eukprot:scaffold238_cov111-Isochrysis_galbana.AAC.6